MKLLPILVVLLVFLSSCEEHLPISSISPENWDNRTAVMPAGAGVLTGKTYLAVYSEIYAYTSRKRFNLTATISMRNANDMDTVFVDSAVYYDTHGQKIRSYFDHPILIRPMETVEIVIDDMDLEGGTGGNFIFEWAADSTINTPIFEAVMISVSGQQGLSFVTEGIELK